MKIQTILKTALTIGLLLVGISGCKMDTPMHYYVDPNKPKTVQDIQNALTGAYNQFGGTRFCGRNVPALADISAGLSSADPKSGHFKSISEWTFQDTDAYLNSIWSSGYVVIGATTDVINDAKKLLETTDKEKDKDKVKEINSLLMQAYGLKAYSYYVLVNIFAKDVAQNGATPGLVLVKDAKPAAKEPVSRSSVTDTYAYILELIKAAHEAIAVAGDRAETSPFYINPSAIFAIEAKVNLAMHQNQEAKNAATKALETFGGINDQDYLAMWGSLVPSKEVIFTIKKAEDDNLSANSINNLYGSYQATVTPIVTDLVKETDVRFKLIDQDKNSENKIPHPCKFDGIPGAGNVSNIPVMRYSEMYIIIAEAEAHLGNIGAGAAALFNVAKRDSALEESTFTFSDKEALLKAVADERVREFFSEGYRLFDLRRTGEVTTIGGQEDYAICNFAFPIPANEINAGFMTEQNKDWVTLMPKRK